MRFEGVPERGIRLREASHLAGLMREIDESLIWAAPNRRILVVDRAPATPAGAPLNHPQITTAGRPPSLKM